ILGGQMLVDRHRIALTACHQLGDLGVVVGGAGDRLLPDRRVGGDATQAVLGDQPGQPARRDQSPADVVVPGALPLLEQFQQRVAHVLARSSSWARQAATIASGVKPNLRWTSLRGAEAPNVFMPMTVP